MSVRKEYKWPECEDFYNLMQRYRHTPVEKPIEVKTAYEEIKEWLRQNVPVKH